MPYFVMVRKPHCKQKIMIQDKHASKVTNARLRYKEMGYKVGLVNEFKILRRQKARRPRRR